jgi:hypothetical protein
MDTIPAVVGADPPLPGLTDQSYVEGQPYYHLTKLEQWSGQILKRNSKKKFVVHGFIIHLMSVYAMPFLMPD